MEPDAFRDQVDPDEKEKAQGKHFYRGIAFDEVADRPGEDHHHDHGHNDGNDHHGNFIDHADGRNYRIERKDHVQQDYLRQDHEQRRGRDHFALFFPTFDTFVNLVGAFHEKK